MSAQPKLIKRSVIRTDKAGKPAYLTKLPLWKRYPRLFIGGTGIVLGMVPWGYQLYQALFFTEKDIPYQADWWPSEIRRGKRRHEEAKERREKEALYRAEYERDMAAKAAAKAQLEKVKLN